MSGFFNSPRWQKTQILVGVFVFELLSVERFLVSVSLGDEERLYPAEITCCIMHSNIIKRNSQPYFFFEFLVIMPSSIERSRNSFFSKFLSRNWISIVIFYYFYSLFGLIRRLEQTFPMSLFN